MLLIDAFQQGGFAMYPIMLAGILLLTASARYAARLDPRQEPLVRQLRAVTLTSGLAGSLLGLVHYFVGLNESVPELRSLVTAKGISEMVNDTGLAVFLLLFSSIVCAVGSYRNTLTARPEPA